MKQNIVMQLWKFSTLLIPICFLLNINMFLSNINNYNALFEKAHSSGHNLNVCLNNNFECIGRNNKIYLANLYGFLPRR